MSRSLPQVLAGLQDVQEVFDMDDRLFEANEAGMTMLIEQDQLLRNMLAAQMVQPYSGWSIGQLNKAADRARAYLGLPSVHDLNPDIKAMVEGVKLANLANSVGSPGWPRTVGWPYPASDIEFGFDQAAPLPDFSGTYVVTRCDGMSVDREDSPRRRWLGWLPRIGILPSMTVGLGRDDDEFDGRVLVIQWGRFAFEIFIGRRA